MKMPMIVYISGLVSRRLRQTECGSSAMRRSKAKPGYLVAKTFCSQCHALPFGDQHPPAAWPYVVSRMEGYMESAHKRMPDPRSVMRSSAISRATDKADGAA